MSSVPSACYLCGGHLKLHGEPMNSGSQGSILMASLRDIWHSGKHTLATTIPGTILGSNVKSYCSGEPF